MTKAPPLAMRESLAGKAAAFARNTSWIFSHTVSQIALPAPNINNIYCPLSTPSLITNKIFFSLSFWWWMNNLSPFQSWQSLWPLLPSVGCWIEGLVKFVQSSTLLFKLNKTKGQTPGNAQTDPCPSWISPLHHIPMSTMTDLSLGYPIHGCPSWF